MPTFKSNSSPKATLTDGAVIATTVKSLLFKASFTFKVSSLRVKAPVGQTKVHCPQAIQGTSFISLSKAQPI